MRSRIPTGRHVEALSLCPAARPGFPDRNALVSRFPTPEHIRKEEPAVQAYQALTSGNPGLLGIIRIASRKRLNPVS